MKIAMLGATGRSGVPLVKALVGRGHEVRALVRTSSKARLVPPDAEAITGDSTDPVVLKQLVAGVDAVLDLIGPSRDQPLIRESTTRALLQALGPDPRRVVMVTGAGVRAPDDQPKLADRVIVALLRRLQGKVLADGERAVRLLTASPHQWTIVRVPRLVPDRPGRFARIVANVNSDSGTQVGRQDLAAALVEIVEGNEWVGGRPVVCW